MKPGPPLAFGQALQMPSPPHPPVYLTLLSGARSHTYTATGRPCALSRAGLDAPAPFCASLRAHTLLPVLFPSAGAPSSPEGHLVSSNQLPHAAHPAAATWGSVLASTYPDRVDNSCFQQKPSRRGRMA